jgi:hypothetical protein
MADKLKKGRFALPAACVVVALVGFGWQPMQMYLQARQDSADIADTARICGVEAAAVANQVHGQAAVDKYRSTYRACWTEYNQYRLNFGKSDVMDRIALL